jgi:pilus assembly protein CpaB
MNKRLVVILLSAFVIAAGCSYMVYRVLAKRIAGSRPSTTRVVVAGSDIKVGTILKEEDLKISEMAGDAPKGVLRTVKEAVGRGVVSNIYQNEPILDNRLAAVGSGGGFAATISPGMRACAVKVDDVVGLAGFVTPGQRVDVLITGNPPGGNNATEGPRVRTLLQNIQVLSAGTDIQKDEEGKPKPVQVVNLLVTPEQAENLSLASNQTHIQLVLRNPLDTQIAQPPGTAVANLFSGEKTTPAAPKPARTLAVSHTLPLRSDRVYLVQVFNGTKRTDEKFVSNGGK